MPYRFAIIGCGNIAPRHAAAIKGIGSTLCAVCDSDTQKAQSLATENSSKKYTRLEELLEIEKPDIVAVCTPNGLHPLHTITSLRAGCHVICEKPMAISVKDGELMTNEARRTGKKLFIVKQNRFNPDVVAIKKMADEGKLGKIHSFQLNCFWNRPAVYYKAPWRGTIAYDGGTLFTQFSHFIDLLYWFLGEIDTVQGWRANYNHRGLIEFEDTGVTNILMKSGAMGSLNYTINTHASNMEGSFTLFGEKGTVKIGGQYLNRIDHFSVENEKQPDTAAVNEANSYGFYKGSMSNHQIVYEKLVSSLKFNDNLLVEAEEGLKSIQMIEMIYSRSSLIRH